MSDRLGDERAADRATDPAITGLGVASAALGVLVVVAVVLSVLIWHGHRDADAERARQGDVLRAAAQWTDVLINMNARTVAESLRRLHDGTVGELNANFESAFQPFGQVVARLQAQTQGQVESVALESLHRPLPGDPAPAAQPEVDTAASHTDTVIVIATSVSQNTGSAPLTVHWALRLGISDVGGRLMVSRLETIR